ncbi:hypothetical protein H7696_05645 [Vibrio alginolyticus]|uniref:hypothetical protein n=1 Tax=Vibrio TaxID=662 RepID=UPI0004039DC1|nr:MULTISPECIES: hypothetical protein [Vibrio]EHK7587259.1 hypothetical protein [Vibrio parahaemolyticus]EIK4807893.1 hypothetical protein [Vibrio parahaemolyticus]EIU6868781.1 hypothetical protein [Vibrio parahaemolyticus]MDW2141775.1 hypothetical protein [Vibrio sp. 1833]QNI27883.1 hypothetical protein H7696_05645 [Vibrio alginolyticus]
MSVFTVWRLNQDSRAVKQAAEEGRTQELIIEIANDEQFRQEVPDVAVRLSQAANWVSYHQCVDEGERRPIRDAYDRLDKSFNPGGATE